jgi:hypothetical protein
VPAPPGASTLEEEEEDDTVAEPAPQAPPGATGAPAGTDVDAQPPPQPYKSPHGLFFQAGIGGGALYGSNRGDADRRSFTGVGLSWHLLFGGTMQRRWAGGAGIAREHIPSPRAHDSVIDGDEPNLDQVSFSLDSLVAFVDYHPFQHGFHALGQFGFALFSADRGTGLQVARDASVVASLGAGYDLQLQESLSVGALAQVTYTQQEMWEGTGPVNLSLVFPSLVLTAAYR